MQVTYRETDQNWQNETTIHWFSVSGRCHNFGLDLNDVYGWADNNGEISILDCDGFPLTDGDGETESVRRAIEPEAKKRTEES